MALGLRGFTKGFAAADEMIRQNERLALERKRAERDERMSGLQERSLNMQLDQAKRDQDYQVERNSAMKRYMDSLGGREAAMPVEDGAGNITPGQDAIQPKPFNFNDMMSEIIKVDFKFGKIGAKEIMELEKRSDELKKKGVFDALRTFELTGDVNAFKSAAQKAGFKLPDGAQVSLREDPTLPGLGKFPMMELPSLNGDPPRSVNIRQMVDMSYLQPGKLSEMSSATALESQRQSGADRRNDKDNQTRRDLSAAEIAAKKEISAAEMENRLEGIAMQELGATRRTAISASSREGGRENAGMPTEKQAVQFLMDYQRDNEKAILSDAFKGSNREAWLEKNRAIGERASVLLAQSGYKLLPQVAWQQASRDINTDARFKGLK